ncbi:unnamed protein product, partial [Ectocarpus sp. 12 AP-2014]
PLGTGTPRHHPPRPLQASPPRHQQHPVSLQTYVERVALLLLHYNTRHSEAKTSFREQFQEETIRPLSPAKDPRAPADRRPALQPFHKALPSSLCFWRRQFLNLPQRIGSKFKPPRCLVALLCPVSISV